MFPRDGLLSEPGQSQAGPTFSDSFGSALPTVAEPPWFAPPVDVREDDHALTVVFRVRDCERKALRVRANHRNIFIWGTPLKQSGNDPREPRRAMRVFALPFDFSRRDLRISHADELLQVRVAKRRLRAQSGSTECAA